MAKGSGKKGSKKGSQAPGGPRQRAARLEKALAASLKREAKAASRLQAAQLEVAVLRMALAEVVGEVPAEAAPAGVVEVVVRPQPKSAAARPRTPKAPAAAKSPAAPKTAPKTSAGRPRRTRPAPADR